MSSLLLLNGSPRGPRSNSMKMLSRVAAGWTEAGGGEVETLHLASMADFRRAVAAYGQATAEDVVVLGTPLYTDAMPALVKTWIEALAPLAGSAGNPRIGFLVQSGFNEALHSRPLERYLEKFARRLGGGYAGTIVRGGGEALQAMPDEAAGGLFRRLCLLGGQLASEGRFAPETLAEVARTERLSPVLGFVAGAAFKIPATQFYWNSQLKRNGVWDRRFDAPYAEECVR